MIILIFAVCVVVRAIPELVAYPYPIGYDVVNYYIPVVANIDVHWQTVSSQFPLYVLLLHFIYIVTGLPADLTVVSVATVTFGAFGMSIFVVSRSLHLSVKQSVFVTTFVIFQMAVLRTAWDLHRDIFALTTMMFIFSLLLSRRQDSNWKRILVIFALTTFTVATDRMVGILFCISLAGYTILTKSKSVAMFAAYGAALFLILVIVSFIVSGTGVNDIKVVPQEVPTFYHPINLIVLFVVVDGLLLFPDNNLLLADRWIVLSGILLSIFAGYGIVFFLVKKLKPIIATAIASSVIITVAAIGVTYMIMPYNNPFVMYGVARQSIEDFSPVTMQFNSLDIKDNDKLLSAIDWINKNTEPDAVIVGEKHWRGFMELYIGDQRIYRFSNIPMALAEVLENQGYHVYMFKPDIKSSAKFTIEAITGEQD